MKMKRLLVNFGIAVTVAVITLVFLNGKSTQSYVPRDINSNSANGMMEWLKFHKADLKTGKIDYDYVKEVEKQVIAQKNTKQSNDFELTWQESGPDKVGGRTRAILIDKNNTQIVYAGSVSGGLWKSTNGAQTWVSVNDQASNLAVSSICQTDNGDIYYGTGEIIGATGTGYRGNGIHKSNADGSFTVLPSTSDFNFVIKLVAYNNTVYASTEKGLFSSTDGGSVWTKLIDGNFSLDVAVGSNGNVYASVNNKMYKSDNGSANSFSLISNLPSTNIADVKFDVAPSNSNYVYCSIVYSTFDNPFDDNYNDFDIFRSTDAGTNWESIRGDYTPNFQPLKKQGTYNHVLKVYPKDENKIILGGVDCYKWDINYGWQQISYWIGAQGINYESFYLHADQHTIVFDPEYNGTTNKRIYFGNDGGVFISENDAETFASHNLDYNVTQFYDIAAGPKGDWVAGSQDNGTQHNASQGNNLLRTTEILGGDGFDCAMPVLSNEIKFVSQYYGRVFRVTPTGSIQLISFAPMGDVEPADFTTSMALWETFYDATSIDSVIYVVEDNDLHVGSTIIAHSNQGRRPLPYTLTEADLAASGGDNLFPLGAEIKVWDTYQSLFAYAVNKGIYLSARALNLSSPSIYLVKINEIGSAGHNAKNLIFSKDGNTIFFSKDNTVYKSTNILASRFGELESSTSNVIVTKFDPSQIETQIIGAFPQNVTSIATDPQVSNNIIITTGGYTTNSHVYFSSNAATTVSENTTDNFTDVNGNLPGIPVYSSLISWNSSTKAAVGTEYGIYTTDDFTAGTNTVWVAQTSGLPNVPVSDLFQQTFKNEWVNGVLNHGYIYAATFGRGVFSSKSNAGPVGIDELNSSKENININLYPNPVINVAHIKFDLSKRSDVNIEIYSITGSKVFTNKFEGVEGNNNISLSTTAYNTGTYFVKVSTKTTNEVIKMVVK